MFDIVIVTHGGLAAGLVDSSELIMGASQDTWVFSVQPDADLAALEEAIHQRLEASRVQGRQVVLLTDLLFGTPFNLVLKRAIGEHVFHATGVNLPLLLEVRGRQLRPDGDVADWFAELVEQCRQSIKDVNELAKSAKEGSQ